MTDFDKEIEGFRRSIDNMRCAVVDYQETMILNTIQQIGGTEYQTITIDKNKVLDAFRKYTPCKPRGDLNSVPHFRCPTCDRSVKTYVDSPEMPHCAWCGQALNWS